MCCGYCDGEIEREVKMLPFGLIEQALKLATLLIEGIPPAQRQATAITWFWMWWPVAKLWLKPEQEKQIEALMRQAESK